MRTSIICTNVHVFQVQMCTQKIPYLYFQVYSSIQIDIWDFLEYQHLRISRAGILRIPQAVFPLILQASQARRRRHHSQANGITR